MTPPAPTAHNPILTAALLLCHGRIAKLVQQRLFRCPAAPTFSERAGTYSRAGVGKAGRGGRRCSELCFTLFLRRVREGSLPSVSGVVVEEGTRRRTAESMKCAEMETDGTASGGCGNNRCRRNTFNFANTSGSRNTTTDPPGVLFKRFYDT